MRTTLLLWTVLAATPAMAEFKATLEASDKEIGLEDAVDFTVKLIDAPAGATVEWPKTPDFDERKNSPGRPLTSTTTSGGTTEYLVSYWPKRVGALTFPAVTVKIAQGKSLKTQPVTVNVIAGHVSTAMRAPRNAPRAEFFMHAELEPSTSTLGDPLDLVLRVFVRATKNDDHLSAIDQIEFQLPENFVVDELEVQTATGETIIGGVPFREVQLRRARVLPLTVGTFSATPSVKVIIGKEEKTTYTLTSTLPVVVQPASDARRSFTPDEGQALLHRKPGDVMQWLQAKRTNRPPVIPMKRLDFQ